jgi:quercetin dioxygenase-like cupin family protein
MTQSERLHDAATGQHLTFLRTRRDSGGELLQVEVRLEPGGRVPRHAHIRQDERVTVIDGSIVVGVGRVERALYAGDTADVRRRSLHLVRNEGHCDARFVLEVRPAGRMQGAMRALFAASRAWSALRTLPRRLRGPHEVDAGRGRRTRRRRSGPALDELGHGAEALRS